ncbi:MAG: hypothetical protein QG620_526 [Patescibacteria group bacterium]|nr:hypothetical protein [Patescibacteria group bacterium]
MGDELKPNLEPIEESDMNLKEKFLGGVANETPEKKAENIPVPEAAPERKEGSAEKEAAYAKILAKVPAPAAVAVNDVASDADDIANLEKEKESKIEKLVTLAEMKGIPHAVKVARHMEDNYVLDEFHDRLLGEELHNALVKKGMIKEL